MVAKGRNAGRHGLIAVQLPPSPEDIGQGAFKRPTCLVDWGGNKAAIVLLGAPVTTVLPT
jgi:hypothetical protein